LKGGVRIKSSSQHWGELSDRGEVTPPKGGKKTKKTSELNFWKKGVESFKGPKDRTMKISRLWRENTFLA